MHKVTRRICTLEEFKEKECTEPGIKLTSFELPEKMSEVKSQWKFVLATVLWLLGSNPKITINAFSFYTFTC